MSGVSEAQAGLKMGRISLDVNLSHGQEGYQVQKTRPDQ